MVHPKAARLACLFATLGAVSSAQPVRIPNNTPGFIASASDQGAVAPSTLLTVNVWLKAAQSAATRQAGRPAEAEEFFRLSPVDHPGPIQRQLWANLPGG
jgi:hypothetical protein